MNYCGVYGGPCDGARWPVGCCMGDIIEPDGWESRPVYIFMTDDEVGIQAHWFLCKYLGPVLTDLERL